MAKMISNKALINIAAIGGVFVIGSAVYMQNSIKDRIKSAGFYKKAMSTLRAHPGAVSLMGEPIKERGFDLSDTDKNYCNQTEAQFEVKVKGPKDKGMMYFWANRVGDDWNINRLELELNSAPDKRLKIVDQHNVHSNNDVKK